MDVTGFGWWGQVSGRDGSPSRPFASEGTYLGRVNGGLGEPALPKVCETKKAARLGGL